MNTAEEERSSPFAGWLQKRGSASWKKRYFVLSKESITYYGNPTDRKPRGRLVLTAKTSIHDTDEYLCFQIVTGSRCLTVKALEPSDCEDWRKAILSQIELCQTQSPTKHEDMGEDIREGIGEDMHVVFAAGHSFEISTKYDYIKTIGHGAYGTVISARDTKTNDCIAIKKIPDVVGDIIEMRRIAREVRLLRFMSHDNVIGLIEIFTHPGKYFFDIYIVSDLMETDLHRVIYSKQALTDDHIQYFLYQILCAVKYIHSASIIHRDIKPPNLLLNGDCHLKLCDFGLSRHFSMRNEIDNSSNLTEYVVTRWYRAPEIMLSCADYSNMVDVWAVGCVFGEMLNRKPVFPGNDHMDQIKLIMKVVGTPTDSELHFVNNPTAKRYALGLPHNVRAQFSKLFPTATDTASDLINQMLVLDPEARISVEAALDHPYFADVREEELETKAHGSVDLQDIERMETKESLLEVIRGKQLVSEDTKARLDDME